MCPLTAQLWLSAGTVRCAQLVGPKHIFGSLYFFPHSLLGTRHRPINCRGRNAGVKQAPHQAAESRPWATESQVG